MSVFVGFVFHTWKPLGDRSHVWPALWLQLRFVTLLLNLLYVLVRMYNTFDLISSFLDHWLVDLFWPFIYQIQSDNFKGFIWARTEIRAVPCKLSLQKFKWIYGLVSQVKLIRVLAIWIPIWKSNDFNPLPNVAQKMSFNQINSDITICCIWWL